MKHLPWLALIFLFLLHRPVEGQPQLLAYFPFDSDFADASGNGNPLTVAVGTPEITSAAGEQVFGAGALDIDSTTGTQEFLNLTNPIRFGPSDAWSVSFWARRRPGTDVRSGMVLGDPSNTNDFIWLSNNATQVEGLRFRSSDNENANFGGFPDDGEFHHWVVISDGAGKISAYRDNVALTPVTATGSFNITSVAHAYNATTQSMDGQIDELYIYSEAISATKVNELYTGGVDSTPPTLAASGISADQDDTAVVENTPVTFTVSFSEDMDATTVDASDFGNAGTAPIGEVLVTRISASVFSVQVTPTGPGSLQLKIIASAVIKDVASNMLNTSSAIVGDTVITVERSLAPPVAVTRLRVFLVGGQSNADGRADSSALPTSPVNLQQPQADIDFYQTSLTTLRPLSQFGPEITMGRRLADSIGKLAGTRVAIIKYGVGGTSLEVDWKAGGDATSADDGPRYVSFQTVVADGMAALAAAYPGATIEIEGMLWVQGERDAVIGAGASYQANLTAFISDVRVTYGAGLPFVVSRLSSGQTSIATGQLTLVRAAQAAVAAADPLATLIDTDSFGVQSDLLHFDAAGQQQLGTASAGGLLSFLPFTSPTTLQRQGNGDFQVAVPNAFPGFIYTLENSISLLPGEWSDGDSETATGATLVLTYTPGIGETKRFFRVKRSPAP